MEAAHKKGTGSTKNGRDSNPQYLGVKKYGGEVVSTGNIIIRQRGNKVRPHLPRAVPRAKTLKPCEGKRCAILSAPKAKPRASARARAFRLVRAARARTRPEPDLRVPLVRSDTTRCTRVPARGTGKDFTLFALRAGRVLFKPGANGKKTVRRR